MKKSKPARKKWLRIHQRHAWLSSLRERKKRKERLQGFGAKLVTLERQGTRRQIIANVSRKAPSNFDIESNFEETARFVSEFRKKLDRTILLRLAGQPVRGRAGSTYVDFVPIKHISLATALMFAAEYDRALVTIPDWNLSTFDAHKWNPGVRSVLRQIGFMELLKIQKSENSDLLPGKMQITPFSYAEGIGNEEAAKLLMMVANLLGVRTESVDDAVQFLGPVRLFDAIIEATENTRLHAYENVSPDHARLAVKRWWMSGAVDQAEGRLTVVIYDRGATIPATLPHSAHWGRIKRGLQWFFGGDGESRPENDAVSLDLAMSRGKSSTGLENRGKGLKVLRRVVDECSKGRLLVMSRRGKYVYESGKKRVYSQLPVSLEGTLIQWELWRPEWRSMT